MSNMKAAALSVLAALALTACGGGGGGGGNNNPGGGPGGGYQLPERQGLAGDAGNQNRLFYTVTGDDGGLFAVDPARPEQPQRVDADAALPSNLTAGHYFFHSIHQGDWDPASGRFGNLRAERVFYADVRLVHEPYPHHQVEYRRVSADPTPLSVTHERISADDSLAPLVGMRRFLQYDLNDADGTLFAYPADLEVTGPWQVFRIGDDAATDPIELDPAHRIVATSWDPATRAPGGWLVIDSDGDRLGRVDAEGDWLGYVDDAAGAAVDGLTQIDPFAWEVGDGSQLLVLQFEAGEPGELWHYRREGANTTTGSIRRLLNAAGEPLEFPAALFAGGFGVDLPPAERIAFADGAFYFFQQAGVFGWGEATLVRVDADGWEALLKEDEAGELAGPIVAGEQLVWTMNDTLASRHRSSGQTRMLEADEIIDGAYVTGIELPVLGSRDGWVFYNREMFRLSGLREWTVAVAARADGSARIEIEEARWVGASSSGRSTSAHLGASEPSEVFLLRGERELAAVSAADPAAGAVRLGQLREGAEDVRLFGPAPGPHRLLQVEHPNGRYEVIYVNTREQDSLLQLMAAPRVGTANRPADLF